MGRNTVLGSLALLLSLSASNAAAQWSSRDYVDEFTDEVSIRTFSPDYVVGIIGIPSTRELYAHFRAEPDETIAPPHTAFDVKLRVDKRVALDLSAYTYANFYDSGYVLLSEAQATVLITDYALGNSVVLRYTVNGHAKTARTSLEGSRGALEQTLHRCSLSDSERVDYDIRVAELEIEALTRELAIKEAEQAAWEAVEAEKAAAAREAAATEREKRERAAREAAELKALRLAEMEAARQERIRAAQEAERAAREAAKLAAVPTAEELTRKRERQHRQLQLRYVAAIKQKVSRNWRIPPGYDNAEFDCTVRIRQGSDGTVLDTVVESCKEGSPALRTSIANAVWASSPLPSTPDRSIFERSIRLYFNPH